MQGAVPSFQRDIEPSEASRTSSILVVEGATLTKLSGGGVRSRVILSSLKALGDVHVISIAKKARHVARIDKVTDVASHSIIVGNQSALQNLARFVREVLFGARSSSPPAANDVTRKIQDLIEGNRDISLLVLRYINAWEQSNIEGSKLLDRVCVWLDLDDRADKIALGKMQESRFWLTRKLATRTGAASLHALELAARQSDVCSLASATDVVDFAPGAHVIELANVVPTPANTEPLSPPSKSKDILFVGTYDWPPNVAAITWFVDHCWPQISAQCADARLQVVGTGKPSVRDALARKYEDDKKIIWHHNVPDLHASYANCRMVISPVQHGSGSKIKVVEAAAFARPIVVTPHSARGLHPSMINALKTGETAAEFAKCCMHYLAEPSQADADGKALEIAQRTHHSEKSFATAAYSALQKTEQPPSIPSEIIAKFSLAPSQSNEVHS